jgi:hypothetical protein
MQEILSEKKIDSLIHVARFFYSSYKIRIQTIILKLKKLLD